MNDDNITHQSGERLLNIAEHPSNIPVCDYALKCAIRVRDANNAKSMFIHEFKRFFKHGARRCF